MSEFPASGAFRVIERLESSSRIAAALAAATLISLATISPSRAGPHQTDAVTPLAPTGDLPFRIELQAVDVGNLELPTLHSYAAAQYDGKWVLVGGRTNGLHGFEQSGSANFPTASQNRDLWVIDFANGQSWHRALDEAATGLSGEEVAALTSSNNQFAQVGDRLYTVGGYGERAGGGLGTMDALTAVDLPGIVAWAMGGAGTAADHVRQTTDARLTLTGGAMYELNGRMQLVLGQNFAGGYSPSKTGAYTQQIRSFEIVDDGATLGVANWDETVPDEAFRRRDLNVFPVLRPDGAGGEEEGLAVLSGVFTPDNGAWTVPIEINATGVPSMADPTAADTFKQGFNGYHSAKLGLYSQTTGAMHEVLFGGISLQFRDEATGDIVTDDNFPFVNDVTAVSVDAAGEYAQRHLGYFPEILDQTDKRLRFGANAEFFLDGATPVFANGVIDLDAVTGATTLGYVFGGLASNSPHTRGVADAISGASNRVFAVVITPVPEPATALLAALAFAASGTGSTIRRRYVRCSRRNRDGVLPTHF
ncbi:MAG: hypothetical protein KDA44_04170 [Planctomycetales bacterium]|nr:hypothetical protein [Planctomycetales bacterium]